MEQYIINKLKIGSEVDENSLQLLRILLGWSQIGVYGFVALSLLGVWFFNYRKTQNKSDIGLVLLALFFGTLLFQTYNLVSNWEYPITEETTKKITCVISPSSILDNVNKNILSALNSLCLSLSFCFFNIVKKNGWRIFDFKIWSIVSLFLISTTIVLGHFLGQKSLFWGSFPDVALSILLFTILFYILIKQFLDRGGVELVIIAGVVYLLILSSQIYFLNKVSISCSEPIDFFTKKVVFNFWSLIATSALGTLFLALAFTWAHEEYSDKELAELRRENQGLKESSNMPKIELTKSEKEVLELVCQGKTYREIAEARGVGEEGIITHVRNIERKLGVKGKENLAEYAKKNGFCPEKGN
jgi:DNA-binding CsgD family transcriptional regulator